MVSPQQQADAALAEWQRLRNAGLTPEQRLDALMAEFFLPPPPCDVEYAATERDQLEIWANA